MKHLGSHCFRPDMNNNTISYLYYVAAHLPIIQEFLWKKFIKFKIKWIKKNHWHATTVPQMKQVQENIAHRSRVCLYNSHTCSALVDLLSGRGQKNKILSRWGGGEESCQYWVSICICKELRHGTVKNVILIPLYF